MAFEIQNSKLSALQDLSRIVTRRPDLGQVIPYAVVRDPDKDISTDLVHRMISAGRLRVLIRCDTTENVYPDPCMWAAMPRNEVDLTETKRFGSECRKVLATIPLSEAEIELKRALIIRVASQNLLVTPAFVKYPVATVLNFTRPREDLAFCGQLTLTRAQHGNSPRSRSERTGMISFGWGQTLQDHYMESNGGQMLLELDTGNVSTFASQPRPIPADLREPMECICGKVAKLGTEVVALVDKWMADISDVEHSIVFLRFVAYKDSPNVPEYYDLRIRTV